eukprot:gene18148-19958_t
MSTFLALITWCCFFVVTTEGYVKCPSPVAVSGPVLKSKTGKTTANKRFNTTTGYISRHTFPSAISCYLECMANCFCGYANYKEEGSNASWNCEHVQYSSCARNDKFTMHDSQGWIAMEFEKVNDDNERQQCCNGKALQKKLDDWCSSRYPDTHPFFSGSEISLVKYYWRCYSAPKDQYHFNENLGHYYYSKHSSLVNIINSDPEYLSLDYVIGGLGMNCKEVCELTGKQCSSSYITLNTVYPFHEFGFNCLHTNTTADCYDATHPPMYYPSNNTCTGFINVHPGDGCGTFSDPMGRRLCRCVKEKHFNFN